MHILVINVFFAPETYGGATIVAEEVAGHLRRDHGVRITAISAVSRADLAPYAVLRAEVDGIQNHMINLPPGRSHSEHYRNPQVAERIVQIARQVAPDLAHLHCVQEIGADTIPALRRLGLPVVLSTHDFWWICERQFMLRPDGRYCGQNPVRIAACRGCVDDHPRAEVRFHALRDLAGQADLITYPSRFARDLCEGSGLAPGKGVVWENGVRMPGPGFFDRQARRRDRDSRVVFGFVGGPSRMKGWPLLRAALTAPARAHGPQAFRGLLVDGARDGGWWDGHDIACLRGDWSVVPRYSQDSLDRFFAEIDVLLFLSQWKETFGLTIREALARGIRVIQTDSGGTTEHGGGDLVEMMPMGWEPDRLNALIAAEVARGQVVQAPVPVTDTGAQAAELLALIGARGLVADRGAADAANSRAVAAE